MKDEYRNISDKTVIEGSFARDLINANSVEFENTYLELAMIYEASFADTSWGDFLTRKCAEFGIDRKLATYSVGEVTFSGAKNITISTGTIVAVPDGNQYSTDEVVTTDENGEATVSVTCLSVGSAGNVAEGMISQISTTIYGLKSVANAEATHDGYDEEDDDELFLRYIIALRTPATSGNVYHYYNWASEVEGVGVVKIIPLWNSPGTVKVLFLDSNGQIASDDLIQKVYEHIEEYRPIGADVMVVSAHNKVVDIEVDVKGTLDVTLLLEDINAWIVEKGLDLKYLSYAKVGDLIMNQPLVEDWDNLLLNGKNKVTLESEEIVKIGEVIVHAYNS